MRHVGRFVLYFALLLLFATAFAVMMATAVYVLVEAAKASGLWLLVAAPLLCLVVYGAASLTWQERHE